MTPGAEAAAYRASGVDYSTLDAAKLVAQAAAARTSANLAGRGAQVDDTTRGEPATIVEVGGTALAVVLECLGTKSAIARAVEEQTGLSRWDAVAYDTVAAAVNDCCCLGALPVAVNAYFATGSASWYAPGRHEALVAGFARACDDAGAAWTGGESPTLAGVVEPGEIDLAASVLGVVPAGRAPWRGEGLRAGDEIVLLASSGLHANGASLARSLAARLPAGYATELPSGRLLGEALLDESVLYAAVVEALVTADEPVHYASHITGHGLRKLMRADAGFSYRLRRLPPVPEVLSFLAAGHGLGPREAYATLNMGCGYALFCAPGAAEAVVAAAERLGHGAMIAGQVETGPRRVVLEPLGVSYEASELELR